MCLSGPLFTVSHKQVEQYRSPVYDRVKKGDISMLMVLSQPVVVYGDVMIEFFNKPKMLSKVGLCCYKGKGPVLDVAVLHDEHMLRSTLQSWKWRLIGMS